MKKYTPNDPRSRALGSLHPNCHTHIHPIRFLVQTSQSTAPTTTMTMCSFTHFHTKTAAI